jgi:UDP-2,3-diacylglucosamine pyrophosphatase LpxH
VLRAPGTRTSLLAALPGVQRLVLLGDVLELRHGPIRDSLAAAQPVLEALGAALSADAEVVIVPGNHDHELMAPWLARRALEGDCAPLGLETPVTWQRGEPLARIAHWLAPAQVRAAYPGVWLSREVYATHGHYLDLHTTVPLIERLGAGMMARIVGGPAPSDAEGYEAILAPIYAWIHALAQRPGRPRSAHSPSTQAWQVLNSSGRHHRVRRSVIRAGLPLAVRALGHGGLGDLRADVSTAQLRRAALAAMAQVADHLAPGASQIVFGHTHRAGPLPGEPPAEWVTATGVRLINCGCWIHDPAYLGREPSTSPYRPGFAVRLEDDRAPELVNLLD